MALIPCPECGAEISSAAAACVHCGRPRSPSRGRRIEGLALRALALVLGGGLAWAVFLGAARANPENPLFVNASAVGACGALAAYWFLGARYGRPLRWPHVLGLAVVGSVLALLLVGVTWRAGDVGVVVFALRFATGTGVPYGLVFGTAAALILYGIRGSAARAGDP